MGATYRKRGRKSWLVTVHHAGQREHRTVRSEQDAKALVQHIHKQELAGVNVIAAIQKARAVAAPAPIYPTLRDALPEWIDAHVAAREVRGSTGTFYKKRLKTWVYPHVLPEGRRLGDLPVDQVSREMLGAVIQKMRSAGRSLALINGVRVPLKAYYTSLIETKLLPPGANPAADLKFYIGKSLRKRAKATTLSYFAQEEGPQLIATAKAMVPRWAPFIMTGLLAGLRWGESAALFKSDIDWQRGRLHVQRTVSEGRMEPPKDHEGRRVKASPALLEALRAHVEAMDLEGQVKAWTPEQRRLVFPNPQGKPVSRTRFFRAVWQPLLKKAGLPYRRYHSTRHTYATWLLENGTDIRYVQQQLGHASIAQTADTYGHVRPERHEAAVDRLDAYTK